MNIFNSGLVKRVQAKWRVIEVRDFDKEEKDEIAKTEVVASDYGRSVIFFFKGGDMSYIPLEDDSSLSVGDSLDLETSQVVILAKEGRDNIVRIRTI